MMYLSAIIYVRLCGVHMFVLFVRHPMCIICILKIQRHPVESKNCLKNTLFDDYVNVFVPFWTLSCVIISLHAFPDAFLMMEKQLFCLLHDTFLLIIHFIIVQDFVIVEYNRFISYEQSVQCDYVICISFFLLHASGAQ